MRRGPRLPPEELAPYLLELPDPPAPFDWPAVFGADRPVEIEIGFGKGLFLLTAGQPRPDVSFVGVEIVRKYQLFTATRLAKRGLSNVRVACGDGRLFLRDRVTRGIAPGAARLLSRSVVEETTPQAPAVHAGVCGRSAAGCLRPGGRLHFVSDVEDYFHDGDWPACRATRAAAYCPRRNRATRATTSIISPISSANFANRASRFTGPATNEAKSRPR